MTACQKAIADCRKILEPSFARYWNTELSLQSRRWFLDCAGVDRVSRTVWAEFTDEQKAAIRRAYAGFMSAAAPVEARA